MACKKQPTPAQIRQRRIEWYEEQINVYSEICRNHTMNKAPDQAYRMSRILAVFARTVRILKSMTLTQDQYT